jgi:DNA replication protein DnaC
MAATLETRLRQAQSEPLAPIDLVSCLVSDELARRGERLLERRLRYAKLRGNACIEDIDYRAARGLDRTLMRSLANDSGWVQRHENIFIIGPTGVGKSFLGCALAQKACRDGSLVLYTRAAALFRDLALARADGSSPSPGPTEPGRCSRRR